MAVILNSHLVANSEYWDYFKIDSAPTYNPPAILTLPKGNTVPGTHFGITLNTEEDEFWHSVTGNLEVTKYDLEPRWNFEPYSALFRDTDNISLLINFFSIHCNCIAFRQ